MNHISEELQKRIETSFILTLVLAGINIVLGIVNGGFPIGGVLLLGVAIWWKLRPGMGCAVAALIVSIGGALVGAALGNGVSGWLIIIAAIEMFRIAKELTKEEETNMQNDDGDNQEK